VAIDNPIFAATERRPWTAVPSAQRRDCRAGAGGGELRPRNGSRLFERASRANTLERRARV